MMKKDITNYKFHQYCDNICYSYLTINSVTIVSHSNPMTSGILFERKTLFYITFIIENFDTAILKYEMYMFEYEINYEITKGFSFYLINLKIQYQRFFYQLLKTKFEEKEKEYSKNKLRK